MIGRYDEILSEKANRVEVKLISNDVERLINMKLKKTKDDIDSMAIDINTRLNFVDEFTDNLSNVVLEQVRKVLKDENAKPGGPNGPPFDILQSEAGFQIKK